VKRIALWLASTATIVVLAFGYHTSTNKTSTVATPITEPAVSTPTPGISTPSPSVIPTPTKTPTPAPAPATTTKEYTGDVAQTRWGPVQVKVTVTDSKITAVDVVQYPNGNPKDQEINSYALPELVQSTLSNQSAQVDMISGATVTSDGYVQSLQSALDQAGR
jgi:uncharacterized protein with FMN-binding domain